MVERIVMGMWIAIHVGTRMVLYDLGRTLRIVIHRGHVRMRAVAYRTR